VKTIGGVIVTDGYPWDFSFKCSPTVFASYSSSDSIYPILFENISIDPFRNEKTIPIILIVFFATDLITKETNATKKTQTIESPFAQIHPDLFFRRSFHYANKPPKIQMCYLEVSIAATYFFGLKSAIFVSYNTKSLYSDDMFTWEISSVENLKFERRIFLGCKSEVLDISEKITQIFHENSLKYSNNLILCSDVSPVDTDHEEYHEQSGIWQEYLCGSEDGNPFEELSKKISENNPWINIWIVKSHKELAQGAKLFAASTDMELLPKHNVCWH
jgi:hypothetical protein